MYHCTGLPGANFKADVEMRRLWILLRIELLARRHDPISALGGLIPTIFILLAFGPLFGGRLSFKIAVINHDTGSYGSILRETFDRVVPPFGTPYYDVLSLDQGAAWERYRSQNLDGVWVIPEDFSNRVKSGKSPKVEMYFNNYNDDRAKNHRIYSTEILWSFYKTIGMPPPPLETAEEYPLPEMIDWFSVISVGAILLSFMLGGDD